MPLGLRCFHKAYLVKEYMCHAISRVDCDHTVKVRLGLFEKALGRFMVFPTVGILRHVKADRSSVYVKDRIVLVWE
jgi:hypothetical protein